VANVESPKPECDRLSSLPSAAVSVDSQNDARRLRLFACQVSSVVIVRSSKPGPPSNCASSRLCRNCSDSSCPGAHVQPALPPTLSPR
jgi:hypothetical protein